MEECPRCGRMTAEKCHHTNEVLCYAKDCLYNQYGYEDPDTQEELLPLEHKSIDLDRLKHPSGDLEKAFAEKWENINRPDRAINFGMGTLQDLMVNQREGTKVDFWITQREATIVATVIQWLGTNVGFGFLLEVLSKVGMTVTYTDRVSRELEAKEKAVHPKRLLILEE